MKTLNPRFVPALLLALLLANAAHAQEAEPAPDGASPAPTVGLVIATQGNEALRRIREEAWQLPRPELPAPAPGTVAAAAAPTQVRAL